MESRWEKWAPLGALVLSPVVGLWLGLAVQLVLSALVLGWVFGRVHERRLQLRLQALAQLEAFTEWAEQALAVAPEELDAEQESMRRALQADYQAAQKLLQDLR